METFVLTEEENEAPVMGVSTTFVENILKGEVLASDDDPGEKMDLASLMIQEHMYALAHQEAEKDPTFLQIVPCVMVQAVPTRKIRTASRTAQGHDSEIMSLCAHGHIADGKPLQEAVDDMVQQQFNIAPDQMFSCVLAALIAPPMEPANGNHLMLMYAYRIVDFLERSEDHNGLTLNWMTVDDLMNQRTNATFDPWNQFVAPILLPVADMVGRDVLIRFVVEDGKQRIMIKDIA